LISLFLIAAFLEGCDRTETAVSVLERNGFTEIRIDRSNTSECSAGDVHHYDFTAKSAYGVTVMGTICGGGSKGSTLIFRSAGPNDRK
jgi:hypothetical protein